MVNLTALINPFHVTRGHLLGKHPGAGVGEGQSRLEEERGAGADPDPDHLEDQVGHRLVHVLVVHFDDPVLADQAMERDPDRAGFGAGPTQRASVGEFFKFLVAAQNWREDFTQRTGVDGAVALAPNVTINVGTRSCRSHNGCTAGSVQIRSPGRRNGRYPRQRPRSLRGHRLRPPPACR